MNRTARIALALLLSLAAGCHRDNKEAQLKALDEAYKSGVFTKEEYDAKRQAIVGPPPAPAPVAETAPPVSTPPEPPSTPPVAAAPPPTQVARPKPVQSAPTPVQP